MRESSHLKPVVCVWYVQMRESREQAIHLLKELQHISHIALQKARLCWLVYNCEWKVIGDTMLQGHRTLMPVIGDTMLQGHRTLMYMYGRMPVIVDTMLQGHRTLMYMYGRMPVIGDTINVTRPSYTHVHVW